MRSHDLRQPFRMQKTYRLGRRRGAWLLFPLAIALGLATALLWPQASTSSVLIANHDLAEGSVVTAADFDSLQVSIRDSTSLYLAKLPTGAILISRLAKGQLLARNQLAPSPIRVLLPTVLQFKDPLPGGVRVGAEVDVWATERTTSAEPAPIALGCSVANLRVESALGQKASAVEVGCAPEFLPDLLRAKATEAVIALVLQPTMLEQ